MSDSPGSGDSRASQSQKSVQFTPDTTLLSAGPGDPTSLQKAWKYWLETPDGTAETAEFISECLRWPRDSARKEFFFEECQDWIKTYNDKKTKFLMKDKYFLVVCDRCGRMYHQNMSEADPEYRRWLPTYQLSFASCPANIDGSCYKGHSIDWFRRRNRINLYYSFVAIQTMRTLRNKDLPGLIRSILSFGRWHELPSENQLILAYKSMRIDWIRSFSAYEQGPPTNLNPGQPKPAASMMSGVAEAAEAQARYSTAPTVIERGNKQVNLRAVWSHMTNDQISMWGDVRYDLNLFYEDRVTESDLISVYGMKLQALEFLHIHKWDHEIDYLNAYAGMRHLVSGDHYFLMRTACQRVSTAMDRVLDAYAAGYVLKPGCEKLYALSGLRFQELLSSLCADLFWLHLNMRAVEKPLDASWWKSRTKIVKGKRVEVAYAIKDEELSTSS